MPLPKNPLHTPVSSPPPEDVGSGAGLHQRGVRETTGFPSLFSKPPAIDNVTTDICAATGKPVPRPDHQMPRIDNLSTPLPILASEDFRYLRTVLRDTSNSWARTVGPRHLH